MRIEVEGTQTGRRGSMNRGLGILLIFFSGFVASSASQVHGNLLGLIVGVTLVGIVATLLLILGITLAFGLSKWRRVTLYFGNGHSIGLRD